MTDQSVVFDLDTSAERTRRYWRALRDQGISRLGAGLPPEAPARSFLWPFLTYAGDPARAFASRSLKSRLDDERRDFTGFPMAAPGEFLAELGVGDAPGYTFVPAAEVARAPNENLRQAVRLIEAVWPEAGAEIGSALLGVAWIRSPGGGIVSGCGPKEFGMVLLNAEHYHRASAHELATSLIHEQAHHALFVETARDPLIPEDFAKPLWSPLRKEMRPAIGVLHAVFTIARIGQWAKKLHEKTPGTLVAAEIERLRAKYFTGLRATMENIKSVRVSPQGQRILDDIAGSISVWESLRG
jgi:hypothetical protein